MPITSAATTTTSPPVDPALPEVAVEPAPALGKEYKNTTFRFSLSIPDGFVAHQFPPDENNATAITLQNLNGDGVQILVTPKKESSHVLTADDVRGSIPNMKVIDAQDVSIGSDYTGVAFKSDNQAFKGNSREVWFYFRGNLYQISTYARLDPLLKSIFSTWKFY